MPANGAITEEQKAEMLALHLEGKPYRQIARLLEVDESTVRYHVKRAALKGKLGYRPVLPGFEIKGTTTKMEDGSYVRQHRERTEKFEMPDGLALRGMTALVDSDGMVIHKHIMARSEAENRTELFIKSIEERFNAYIGPAALPAPEPRNSCLWGQDTLSVYPIADQHVGLLAWGRETGEPYDLRIGMDRMRAVSTDLVYQSPASSTALLLNLGDWYHTDDQRNVTPGHQHQLDVDSRYMKIVDVGVQMEIDLVDLMLQKHEKVIVRNLRGNHDPHSSVALTMAMRAFYRNEPRVEILVDPSDFFYYRFGVNLIGATHGHKLKPEAMVLNMASHPDWSATKNHWFLYGHWHKEMAHEIGGCRTECVRTITGKDAYTASAGYLSGKSMQSVTLHAERGTIGRTEIDLFNVGG